MAAPTRAQSQKYERTTQSGFLMRAYRNMLSRVLGVQKREAHYYQGLPILPKNVFYMWAFGDEAFQRLWTVWQASGRERRLAPSVDRLDVTKGYTLDNMRWITHAENSGRLTRRNTTTRPRGAAWHAVRLRNKEHREISARTVSA